MPTKRPPTKTILLQMPLEINFIQLILLGLIKPESPILSTDKLKIYIANFQIKPLRNSLSKRKVRAIKLVIKFYVSPVLIKEALN